jgi:serine/threonine-protein phosphatase 6 regulatory ankyrin repeat subunit B
MISRKAARFFAAVILLVQNTAWAAADEKWVRALTARDLPVIEYLASQGANVNLTTDDGRTALMLAAGAGHVELLHKLLTAKADVNFTNDRGGTALMYAATGGDPNSVELLLSHGASVNIKAANGWTAVTLASAKGYETIVKRLLNAGSDVNVADIYGLTPLMRAVSGQKLEVVRILLDEKTLRINAKDDQGETALHYAAASGSMEMSHMLLNRGANVVAKDSAGRTPAKIAKVEGHPELAEFIEKFSRK